MDNHSRRDVLAVATLAGAAAARAAEPAIPLVPFGPHRISRLIPGGNPVSANSHVSNGLDAEMRNYFTTANIKKLLAECERNGINTWQSRADRHIMRVLHEYRQEGSRIQWVAQTATEYAELKRNLSEISALKPIAIYLHGNRTDSYWRAGQITELTDALKAIRQTGAMVGLGSHIPEVFDDAESKGWDVDFYMTCLYNLTRPRDEVTRLGGPPQGEYFRDADREIMLQRVKRAGKPCLIFKVYGATRQCATPESRQAAMDLAFRHAKPGDAVVVGMFPKYSEQVAENCRLVVKAIANRPVS